MTTFVKQYGLPRTGTNAVRALLETYVPDTAVLMHVLGDKHSPPVDLEHAMRLTRHADDPAGSFVALASLLAPAMTTRRLASPAQRGHVQSIAGELYAAVRAEEMRIVVCVREPYDWARAVLRWRAGWNPAYRDATSDELERLVAGMCDDYNRCNRTWLELLARRPATAVVRHEELTGALDRLVARLAGELALPRTPAPGACLPQTLGMAEWDQDATPLTAEPDAERRRRARTLAPLDDRFARVVTDHLDWEIAATWGYAPAGARN